MYHQQLISWHYLIKQPLIKDFEAVTVEDNVQVFTKQTKEMPSTTALELTARKQTHQSPAVTHLKQSAEVPKPKAQQNAQSLKYRGSELCSREPTTSSVPPADNIGNKKNTVSMARPTLKYLLPSCTAGQQLQVTNWNMQVGPSALTSCSPCFPPLNLLLAISPAAPAPCTPPHRFPPLPPYADLRLQLTSINSI